MSIDFDSAALQTQNEEEEEEYDQEDYAREQELHKLLTDLPDDMLEDSRDSSSPELDYSTCSHPANRPQHLYGHPEWSNQPGPLTVEDNPQGDPPHHQGCTYDNTVSQPHGPGPNLQGRIPHLPKVWDPHHCENYPHESGDYSIGTTESDGPNNYSLGESYEQEAYSHTVDQGHGEHAIVQNRFQNFDNGITRSKDVNTYKVSYHPHKPASPPKIFSAHSSHQNGPFNQLQREFLDSSPSTADAQEHAQLKILNKARSKQIEELEQKLEDSRRKMRYLEHQFAIVRDEKEGLAVSLKESSHLMEEVKERESQLKVKVRSLEQHIQALTEREQENIKKQHAAEAAVDGMQQQLMELCRSDTLTRVREQHDRDMAVLRDQHEARVLALQQNIDSHTQSLDQQVQAVQRLRDQVKQLEKQREEEQVDRATIINTLTKRLEESQQQCAKLLQTGSVQEMSQMQIKLQQAQSSRNISENMNRTLQKELNELKEQITLYESAVKLGAVSFDLNPDWEHHLSESCIDLGIKTVTRKHDRNHSTPVVSDPNLPKGDLVRELKNELQRCLAQLKSKRQKISQLQEELKTSQDHVERLGTQLAAAERSVKDSAVRESCLEKHLEPSSMDPHTDLARLEEERKQLQKRVEGLEVHNMELKQSEEKVKVANFELCTKMREMIQELDQEKQEAAERNERTQQQYRDDVVQHVHAELAKEHSAHVVQLTAQHQQHIQQLESKLADLSQEVLAVQECYISVCKEKDKLEENLQSRIADEKKQREIELKRRGEAEAALDGLRDNLVSQHQEALAQFKVQCARESERELQLQLASAQQSWQQGQDQLEKVWAHRLEEAVEEGRRARAATTRERFSQTDGTEAAAPPLPLEQLEARLDAQRVALQREADGALTKAVEEAVRRTERELQQIHLQDMTSQVEDAVSRAHDRWLQDLTSIPEYKASLQSERELWGKLQHQHIQEQVSAAIKAAENRWQGTLAEKGKELEDCMKREAELEEQVLSLNTQLEHSVKERAVLLENELSAARAAWHRGEELAQQEELRSLKAQLQRVQQENQTQLERSIERAREEALAQSQETLLSMEEEWRGQQALRLKEEQSRAREEMLAELKEVLLELHNLKRVVPEDEGSRDVGVRTRLRTLCRQALFKAVAHAKQEWQKKSEDKLMQLLKENQELHENELQAVRKSAAQAKDGTCGSSSCAETVAKLQKTHRDLQKHLQKACRQLQSAVREHRRTLHKLKEEHEDILHREREAHAKELEEVKLRESGAADSQQNLQAALEEMKQQYLTAVQKIRGDMLHYLQESKGRAAELIRAEVLRERQDTARQMRTYYLTCLQELLHEGGQTTGAEKMIISAASKLAAMAKVLETPQPKKKLHMYANGQETNNEPRTKVSGTASNQSLPVITETHEDYKKNQVRQLHSITETVQSTQTAKLRGLKLGGKASQPNFLRSERGSPANGLGLAEQIAPVSLGYHNSKGLGDSTSSSVHSGDLSSARKHNRDMYIIGKESVNALTPQLAEYPSLIEEAPVKDDGQSDRSLSSNSSIFTNVYLTNTYPSRTAETVRALCVAGRSVDVLDFGSALDDNSDVTIYKEIKAPVCVKPTQGIDIKTTKIREPIPGSEEEKIHKQCAKSLFSEFKMRQQDSGFDSPLSQIHK